MNESTGANPTSLGKHAHSSTYTLGVDNLHRQLSQESSPYIVMLTKLKAMNNRKAQTTNTRNMLGDVGTCDQKDMPVGHTGHLLHEATWLKLGNIKNFPNT